MSNLTFWRQNFTFWVVPRGPRHPENHFLDPCLAFCRGTPRMDAWNMGQWNKWSKKGSKNTLKRVKMTYFWVIFDHLLDHFIYVCLILRVNCVHIWVKHEKRAKKGVQKVTQNRSFRVSRGPRDPQKLTFWRQNIKFDMLGVKKWPTFWPEVAQKWSKKWSKNGSKMVTQNHPF